MTSLRTTAVATVLALVLVLGAGITAFGQGAHGHQSQMQNAPAQQGMPMQPGMMGQGMGTGMMGQEGMWHMGPHMMSPEEMQEMMEHMGGMTGQRGPGMMGQMPRMMGQMPGMMGQMPGMMGQGMRGWSGLVGGRVVPMMQLSTDDVRVFFERHLAALGNGRLKVGKVEALDNETIEAEIVTVDESLVESFEVDRHTGMISPTG